MGVKRDHKALERRRVRGVLLLRRGYTEAEVARLCGVSRNAVNLWAKRLAQGGWMALRARPAGRPAALSPAKRAQLVCLLKIGARAAGYATERWNTARVSEVITRHFGVRYTASNVWLLLRSLGWSSQRPNLARRIGNVSQQEGQRLDSDPSRSNWPNGLGNSGRVTAIPGCRNTTTTNLKHDAAQENQHGNL